MTKTKQKYNLLIIMMTTITFLVCNLIAINFKDLNNRIVNKYVIVFIFCIGIALIKKFRKVNLESHKGLRTKIFILIWIALMSSVLISQIVNEELNIINLFILTCIIPVFFFKKESYQIDTYLKIGAILNIIPLIAVLKEINSIGILIAFIGIMSINFSIKKFVEKGKLIQYLIIVICFTFLILMTKSRTALLAFLTVGGLNYFYIVFKNKIKIKTIMISLLIILILILIGPKIYDLLNKVIFNKYVASQLDMTSGRSEMWQEIINDDISLFGYGYNYFLNKFGKGDAHNMFFQVLGHYGIISFILFIGISIYLLIRAIKKKDLEAINFFLCYYMIGMFENLLFLDTRMMMCNILFFFYIGNVLKTKKIGEKT